MEKNSQNNNVDTQIQYDVPFNVHGTEASALGGTSPEMTKLSQLATKATRALK